MRKNLTPAIGAAVLGIGLLLSGCSSDGDPVADDAATPPAATTTTSADTSKPTITSPTTSAENSSAKKEAPISDVPAPPNATTMTCREFMTLDKSHRVAVLKANGATRNFEMVANLFMVTCSPYPDTTIADMLAGKIPGAN